MVLGSIPVAVIDEILYLSKKQREYKLPQGIQAAAYIPTVFTQVKDLVNECNCNRTQNHCFKVYRQQHSNDQSFPIGAVRVIFMTLS